MRVLSEDFCRKKVLDTFPYGHVLITHGQSRYQLRRF